MIVVNRSTLFLVSLLLAGGLQPPSAAGQVQEGGLADRERPPAGGGIGAGDRQTLTGTLETLVHAALPELEGGPQFGLKILGKSGDEVIPLSGCEASCQRFYQDLFKRSGQAYLQALQRRDAAALKRLDKERTIVVTGRFPKAGRGAVLQVEAIRNAGPGAGDRLVENALPEAREKDSSRNSETIPGKGERTPAVEDVGSRRGGPQHDKGLAADTDAELDGALKCLSEIDSGLKAGDMRILRTVCTPEAFASIFPEGDRTRKESLAGYARGLAAGLGRDKKSVRESLAGSKGFSIKLQFGGMAVSSEYWRFSKEGGRWCLSGKFVADF